MLNEFSNVWRFGPRRLGSGPHFEKLLNVQRSVSKRFNFLNVWQSGLERLKNLQCLGLAPKLNNFRKCAVWAQTFWKQFKCLGEPSQSCKKIKLWRVTQTFWTTTKGLRGDNRWIGNHQKWCRCFCVSSVWPCRDRVLFGQCPCLVLGFRPGYCLGLSPGFRIGFYFCRLHVFIVGLCTLLGRFWLFRY